MNLQFHDYYTLSGSSGAVYTVKTAVSGVLLSQVLCHKFVGD